MISAVILTHDEGEVLERCRKSVTGFDEVVEISEKEYPLQGDFAAKRNYALSRAHGEWVLFVDADEEVPVKLAEEIKSEIRKGTEFQGYFLKRRDYFWGRWLRFGETANVRLLRLAKRTAGRWQRKVHEVWQVRGPVGELNSPLKHYPHQTIRDFVDSVNYYSEIDVSELKKEGKNFSVFRVVANPVGKFLENYFWRLGVLDGEAGFVVAFMMSFQSLVVRVKQYDISKAS